MISGSPGSERAVKEHLGLTWEAFISRIFELDSILIDEGVWPSDRPIRVALALGGEALARVGPQNHRIVDPTIDIVHDVYTLVYGAQALATGPIHLGAIMFRDIFYEVEVPMIVGRATIDVWDHVVGLDVDRTSAFYTLDPDEHRLNADQLTDIFDFGLGSVQGAPLEARCAELVQLSQEQMETACKALHGSFSPRIAMQACAYSVELATKAALAGKGLEDKQLADFGHRTDKILTKVCELYPKADRRRLSKSATFMPNVVHERYQDTAPTRLRIGETLRHAQYILGEIMRVLSGYDMRSMMVHFEERCFP